MKHPLSIRDQVRIAHSRRVRLAQARERSHELWNSADGLPVLIPAQPPKPPASPAHPVTRG